MAVTPPLADKFPHKAKTVAFNFATPDFFDAAAREGRRASEREYDLVHLGTLNRRRAAFLAEVLREYHSLRPGARSLIVGAEEDALHAVRDRLPAECEVLGKVAFAGVPALLGNARVGIDVHPWLTPHLVPALAVKVCEYMACGCAVVASAMPVLEGIIEGSGLDPDSIICLRSTEPRDYAIAARQLVDAIIADRDPGAELQTFARHRLNWSGEALKIANLYLDLVGQRECAT